MFPIPERHETKPVHQDDSMSLGPRHALIQALRNTGSEVQLTGVLAQVFSTDRALAAEFVRHLVEQTAKRELAARLPDELGCRSEVRICGGRVDLEFRDERLGWQIFVELKVNAAYGHDQLRRYLESFDPGIRHCALVAITRDVPVGDLPLTDPRWLGSVRWGRLLPSLEALAIPDRRLAAQWLLFLEILDDEGSLGFTRADPELFQAWARATPAEEHVGRFLDAIREPLLAALRTALQGHGFGTDDSVAAYEARGRGHRAVFTEPHQMHVGFRVPSTGRWLVTAGLWAWEDLRFVVKAYYPDDLIRGDVDNAIQALVANGFQEWKGKLVEAMLPLSADRLEDEGFLENLVSWASDRFDDLAASQIFGL